MGERDTEKEEATERADDEKKGRRVRAREIEKGTVRGRDRCQEAEVREGE